MLNLESAEELAKLAGNCIIKGLVIRHRNELTELSDHHLIRLLADFVEEAHEGTRAELKAALAADKSPAVQLAYLNELRQLLDNDVLSPVLCETATLKQELRQEAQHTNPAVITAANALFTVALFQIQAICLFAGREPDFSSAQRKKVGQLYVIATGADEKIADILHEVERQINYLNLAQLSAPDMTTQKAVLTAPTVPKATCTLESICKRPTEAERKELAGKIDAILSAVKQKMTNEDDYPAICTAVYKLVERLGMINNGITARQWKAALLSRYEVIISEGIGKYRIENPSSGVFKEAVKYAFAFISTTYPIWTKNKHLPAIYQ